MFGQLTTDNTTEMTPWGPITPIHPVAFNPYALQTLATPAQAAQVSAQAQAIEAALPGGIGPMAMDPAWLRSDCDCRGGTFVEVPGQPQNSYCLPPAVPTGKKFDYATRGCVPIPGFKPPILPTSAMCYWKGYNICLYGGIALAALLLVWAVGKKKGSAPAAEPKKAETELGAGI
jgi:hypothetical protein